MDRFIRAVLFPALMLLVRFFVVFDRLVMYRFKARFPRWPEELTEAFVRSALRDALPGGVAADAVDIAPVKREISLRSSCAVVSVRAGDARAAAFAKFAPMDAVADRVMFVAQRDHIKECLFYSKLAAQVPARVPRCYFSDFHLVSGNMCLLLEDLSDFEAKEEQEGVTVPNAEAIVAEVAKAHAAFWGQVTTDKGAAGVVNGGSEQALAWTTAFKDPADYIAYTWSAGSGADAAKAALVRGLFKAAWTRSNAGALTVIHGDLRVGNVMFPPADAADQTPVIIDWQAVRRGKGVLDVAYLLTVSMQPEDRRACWDSMTRLYLAALEEHGVEGYSLQELREDYVVGVVFVVFLIAFPMLNAEVSDNAANIDHAVGFGAAWEHRLRTVAKDMSEDAFCKTVALTETHSVAEAMGEILETVG